jgi:site-specific DNA-methyltransferase (adenine-specific)
MIDEFFKNTEVQAWSVCSDCREFMQLMPESCVDAAVTDPPYGLMFMGKEWDHGIPGIPFWSGVFRVLKPGGYLLSFGGTRTFHRLACAIEDAGFEIRDCIMWVYGSGFPKSLDVSKAITKRADPTNTAHQWSGWGTALKPAWEPILVCRKPLSGTVAANVLTYGVGGINIDGCRVGTNKRVPASPRAAQDRIYGKYGAQDGSESGHNPNIGRWPANLIHDGSEEVQSCFPETMSGSGRRRPKPTENRSAYMAGWPASDFERDGDSGSASRFFYCAKASKSDRDGGNTHPTVKPTALMRYLCRLVTPVGGLVLDPFMGSGSTGKACMLEGFRFLGIDKEQEYVDIARLRITKALASVGFLNDAGESCND